MEPVQRLVCGDPVDPREKSRIPPERRKGRPDLDEDLLKQVVGVVVCADKPPDVPVKPLALGCDDLIERFLFLAVPIKNDNLLVSHTERLQTFR